VVKPHALENLGSILDMVIEDGFEVSAMQLFNLQLGQVHEFLELYRYAFSTEFMNICEAMSSGQGSCIAMEVRTQDAVACLRKLCGPHHPEEA
jgi:nucleoside-diphosphate kinase